MNRFVFSLAGALALLAAAPSAFAQHPAPAPAGKSVNLQGGDQQAWMHNQFMHRFYDLSVATLKDGSNVDVAAYEQKSFAIFREFGPSMGVTPDQMQDHLKLIPRQIVQIAKEDPKVLDSFNNFVEAMIGPK